MQYPITLSFDDTHPVGFVEIPDGVLPTSNSWQEYFLAPSAVYNQTKKQWEIIGYGLVHVSVLPNENQMRNKLYSVSGEDRYSPTQE